MNHIFSLIFESVIRILVKMFIQIYYLHSSIVFIIMTSISLSYCCFSRFVVLRLTIHTITVVFFSLFSHNHFCPSTFNILSHILTFSHNYCCSTALYILSLSLYLSIYLYLYLYLYISVYVSMYLSISISIYLYICLSLSLSIYISVYVSLSLPRGVQVHTSPLGVSTLRGGGAARGT